MKQFVVLIEEHYVHCQVPIGYSCVTQSSVVFNLYILFQFAHKVIPQTYYLSALFHNRISSLCLISPHAFDMLHHPIDKIAWLVLVKKKLRCSYQFNLKYYFQSYISDNWILQKYSWLTISWVPESYWNSQEIPVFSLKI